MVRHKKYSNGLNLIVSEGGAISCSFAIMIGTGTINETSANNGISHYIEHMNFKGNKKFTAYQITDIMESLGASYNAYTAMETTCFYSQTIKDSLEKAFEVMAENAFDSIYLDEESAKEKNVIIEEINMSEDTPDDVCYDLLTKAYYGDNGYGRTILGPQSNVSSFTKEDVFNYLNDYYVAENVVISFAGNVTLEEADDLVMKYVMPIIKSNPLKPTPSHNVKCLCNHLVKSKDIEQTHISLAFPSKAYGENRRIVSEYANSILGSGMTSRLFRKIRDELGLAYSVYSYANRYKTTGTLNVYAGVNANEYKNAYDAILQVIEDVKKGGVTQVEVDNVKMGMKVATVFAQEKPLSLARSYATLFLRSGEIYDFEERLREIESVTIDEINQEFLTISDNLMASAVVGKNVEKLK